MGTGEGQDMNIGGDDEWNADSSYAPWTGALNDEDSGNAAWNGDHDGGWDPEAPWEACEDVQDEVQFSMQV